MTPEENRAFALTMFDHFVAMYPADIRKHKTRLAWGFACVTVPCAGAGGLIFFVTKDETDGVRGYTLRAALLNAEMQIADFVLIKDYKVAAYQLRKRMERVYRGATNGLTGYIWNGKEVAILTTMAPTVPEALMPKPAEKKTFSIQETAAKLRAEGHHIQDAAMHTWQFASPGGMRKAEEAIVKVKDGSFSYIGEVMEWFDRQKIEEQPPVLETLFKEYFLRRTGEELSKYIEV
jgi:hypothetical protein